MSDSDCSSSQQLAVEEMDRILYQISATGTFSWHIPRSRQTKARSCRDLVQLIRQDLSLIAWIDNERPTSTRCRASHQSGSFKLVSLSFPLVEVDRVGNSRDVVL